MHPVAYFDFLSCMALLVALGAFLKGWKRAFSRGTKFLLAGLLLFSLVYALCLALEWSGITMALDRFEDFVGALIPMWWAFVFYALIHEITGRDLRESNTILQASEQQLRASNQQLEASEQQLKASNAQLIESEERYRSLVENVPGVVWTTDENGKTVFISSAVQEIYGYAPDDIYEAGEELWFGRIHPDDFERVKKSFEEVFEKGDRLDVEYRIRRKDGEWIWLGDRSIGAYEKDGVQYADGVFFDISERKRLEERERIHQVQLAHVSRLTVAGELASGLAHELNQPLTAIANYAQACRGMIESGHADCPEVCEAAEAISAQALRGGEIIRHLRDFVRKQEPERSAVDFNAIVCDAVELMKGQARQGEAALELDLAEELLTVCADKIQIEQVIVNLLQNGLDAMVEVEPCERVLTVGTARTEGGMAEITIEDRGTGLSEEGLERMFEPFFTTKPDGLGIGLSISRSIIEQHEGHIQATANPGGGTRFTFALPCE